MSIELFFLLMSQNGTPLTATHWSYNYNTNVILIEIFLEIQQGPKLKSWYLLDILI